MAIGQELLNVPMVEMIRSMAFAIADAQVELDRASMAVTQMMSGQMPELDANGAQVKDTTGAPKWVDTKVPFTVPKKKTDGTLVLEQDKLSMMELGFSPTFYQFVDTIIEVRIDITITSGSSYKNSYKNQGTRVGFGGGGFAVNTSQVNASYASKYSHSAEGSSFLRTKLVPVPPPSILEDRIRENLEIIAAATETPPGS